MVINQKILLVEDDDLYKLIIEYSLKDSGFTLADTIHTRNLTRDFLRNHSFDIAIYSLKTLDNQEVNEVSSLFKDINLPLIFLATSPDMKQCELASEYGIPYLLKPFHPVNLVSTMLVALKVNSNTAVQKPVPDYLYLKMSNNKLDKVPLKEISYLKASGNYCYIVSNGKKWIEKTSMRLLLNKLPENLFIRIHNKYAINIDHIVTVSTKEICLKGDVCIPMGSSFKSKIRSYFKA